MTDPLIAYVNAHLATPLSPEEERVLSAAFVTKKLRRHQFLLQEGDVCRFAGFIVKGAMKQYTVDADGREDVLGLFIENWWAGDRESFANGTPSPFFIQAVEETEMLITSKDAYDHALKEQRFMNELLRTLSERQAQQLLKRVHATKTLSAEQRLADLEQKYPEFLQRFPQHLIASYLGMTKETLSRIRSNAGKRL